MWQWGHEKIPKWWRADRNPKLGKDEDWKIYKGIWYGTDDCNSIQQDTYRRPSSVLQLYYTLLNEVAIAQWCYLRPRGCGSPAWCSHMEKGWWCGRATLHADLGWNQQHPTLAGAASVLPCLCAHPATTPCPRTQPQCQQRWQRGDLLAPGSPGSPSGCRLLFGVAGSSLQTALISDISDDNQNGQLELYPVITVP